MKFLNGKSISLLAIGYWLVAGHAFAATEVYFNAPPSAAVGSVFSVQVLLDADRVANAYSATVDFSGPAKLLRTNNADSIITIWHDNPAISDGTVRFGGGSIEPFAGAGGNLLKLDFKALATGTAVFSVSNAKIYLADGQGTEITPAGKDASVIIGGAASGSKSSAAAAPSAETAAETADAVPPEIKFLDFTTDPSGSGQKLLSFWVSDSGSGVADASMRYRTAIFWSGWQSVTNPAPLPGNAWEADFQVRDNAGNSAERVLYDWPALWFLIGEAVLVILVLAAAGAVLRRLKSSRTQ